MGIVHLGPYVIEMRKIDLFAGKERRLTFLSVIVKGKEVVSSNPRAEEE